MMKKNENFETNAQTTGTIFQKSGSVEYQMPKKLADELLKTRKGQDKNMRPQDFLVRYVNEECGLLRQCVRVTTI